MAYNIADLFEHTADAVPDRIALIDRDARLSFAELEERANRIAHALADRGVGVGDHVGIYAQNSHEWIEAMYGAFKIRAIPININFRYVKDELSYLLGNADCVACIFDRQYAPRLEAVLDDAPTVKTFIYIDDGTDTPLGALPAESYDDVCAGASPGRGFSERTPDDLYVLYTGGTTGMPKGVMWRQEDVYMALGQGIDSLTGERVQSDMDMANKAKDVDPLIFLIIPPMMHGAAQWGTMSQMLQGNTIVLLPKFSAEDTWQIIDDHKINSMLITGDAMGRPMIEHLIDHRDDYDVSAVVSVSSSAAIFSPTVKDQFLEVFPNLIITDSIGSSESGFNGLRMVGKGDTQMKGGGPSVTPGPDVVVLDETFEVIARDSDEVGKLARGGNIPLGYYKDEKKTAETFVIASDGTRYAVAGDWAKWEDDGTLTLLGRGSTTINSGGEKIHPEEVEQAIKDHPAVYDCVVVGVPDERWGQTVAAVVQFREGQSAEVEQLADHARSFVAGYKVPRELHVVDVMQRSPSGKPDYPWATKLARGDR
jgi:acyl-CoA synthetase (AMP-forming)/AMP-acid ligase II